MQLSCMRNELILYLESNFRKNEIYDNRTVPVICRQYICASRLVEALENWEAYYKEKGEFV